MSGTITFSQTGVPAAITIVPGPGVDIIGQVPGRGYVSAAIGVDGHLRLLASDGTVEDVGPVAPVIARVAPAGNAPASATPVTAAITIVLPGVAGGALALTGAGRFELINRAGVDVPVYPNPGGAIETAAIGAPVSLVSGETSFFSSPDALVWTVS